MAYYLQITNLVLQVATKGIEKLLQSNLVRIYSSQQAVRYISQ